MSFFKKLSQDSQGIIFAICACFFASILVAVVRKLSDDFHIFFIVMVRNCFGLAFFLPQILRNHKIVFHTNKLHLHVFRGLNGFASMMVWFYVITILPLSEAVSISFIIPILTTLAAIFFLKEKVTSKAWIATIIGFIGILIILRPGFRQFNFVYFYSFISVALWVISNIIIKVMTRTEKPTTIVVHMSLVMFIASIPFALPYIQPLNATSFCWFALLGLVSNLTHICVSNAYAKTELSLVQPFDFTRLIFTIIISYFAFGEAIDVWVIFGSLVILSGVILVMPKRKKQVLPIQPC